jgi:hypothetical protein
MDYCGCCVKRQVASGGVKLLTTVVVDTSIFHFIAVIVGCQPNPFLLITQLL